jgi:2-dehydro-3-deoxy-D-pentonate aldolase
VNCASTTIRVVYYYHCYDTGTYMKTSVVLLFSIACTAFDAGHHQHAFAFPLKGIIPPIVTPLKIIDEDATSILDVEGTRRLIEHVLEGGVSAVFCLGTTGEFAALSVEVRTNFIKLCCEIVDGRVPVLVGVTDTSLDATVLLSRIAKEAGASALVLTTPYYFPLEQSEVIRWVQGVLKYTDLPVMLYNMPQLTRVWYEVETVRFLATNYPQIVGIKDSSGDLDYFSKICEVRKEVRPDDWTVMIGPEHLLVDALQLGGDGGVSGGANIYPGLFVSLYEAATATDSQLVSSLVERVNILQAIYRVGTPGFRYAMATKCALSIKGVCANVVVEPFQPFSAYEADQVKVILERVDGNCVD